MEDARPSTPRRLHALDHDQEPGQNAAYDAKELRGLRSTTSTPRGYKSPATLTPRTLRRITSTDVPDETADQAAAASAAAAASRITRLAALRRRSQRGSEAQDSAAAAADSGLSEDDNELEVEPLLGSTAAAPRARGAGSGSRFWAVSLLVLFISCAISAVLMRGIPGVLPSLVAPSAPAPAASAPVIPVGPRAPAGRLDEVQRFLEWEKPGWHEAGRVDLAGLPTQPTKEQCEQWADMPAMQVLCSGQNPLDSPAS